MISIQFARVSEPVLSFEMATPYLGFFNMSRYGSVPKEHGWTISKVKENQFACRGRMNIQSHIRHEDINWVTDQSLSLAF